MTTKDLVNEFRENRNWRGPGADGTLFKGLLFHYTPDLYRGEDGSTATVHFPPPPPVSRGLKKHSLISDLNQNCHAIRF
jgi:hypothetical protein